jgi:hypothetical protein
VTPPSWRLSARVATYRPADWWLQVVLWTVFFGSPLVTGVLLRAGVDAIDGGRRLPYLMAAAIVATEAVRVGLFRIAAVLWSRWWATV